MRGETVSGASVSCGCKHFNPLPSCEGRPLWDRSAPVIYLFQSTPLMRGETNNGLCDGFYAIFQSTPLMRGETVSSGSVTSAGIFQSTPLMRGETREQNQQRRKEGISIHSPHARGDVGVKALIGTPYAISIHSPHARGDSHEIFCWRMGKNFNPLPSCEGRR